MRVLEDYTAEWIYLDINLIVAVLLLTGQITVNGVFIQATGGFSIPLTGPIIGDRRIVGKSNSKILTFVVDSIDIVLALLLIFGQISVRGTLISSGHFTITVSGPIFGIPRTEVSEKLTKEFFDHFKVFLTSDGINNYR
ncbi:hypothetical protein KHA93_17505 [Bacillus sp. FJAT-49732]|uniref:Uncharacterized protein n=1 Tax=Lederbergia citrisecunda TaxID=2833583 RepID=A0A942TPZ9_9BACI|nr:hypothetical protein [Lederbergia citrisecunda]MBS4201433.1 hypothetical protein [Lederbergia citrisecunda]